MRATEHKGLDGYLERASPFLMHDEARHNLQFGIFSVLRDHPEVYPEFRLWLVEDGDEVVCVALRTPPYNLVLSQPSSDRAIEALVDHLAATGEALPGVTAAEPEAHVFARAWAGRNAVESAVHMREGVYRITRPKPVPGHAGIPGVATERDRGLLKIWLDDFMREALPDEPPGPARERTLDTRLAGRKDAGLWLLEEGGGVVSLAGYGGLTPNGIRGGSRLHAFCT